MTDPTLTFSSSITGLVFSTAAGQKAILLLITGVADPNPDPDPPDPHVFEPPGSFYHNAKIVRKTFIPAIL
jgi:hypothetical protein